MNDIKKILDEKLNKNEKSLIPKILGYVYENCYNCQKIISDVEFDWLIYCGYCEKGVCLNCSKDLEVCSICRFVICSEHFVNNKCYKCMKKNI